MEDYSATDRAPTLLDRPCRQPGVTAHGRLSFRLAPSTGPWATIAGSGGACNVASSTTCCTIQPNGVAIYDGKVRASTLPEGVDVRYLLGIVRNIAHEREGLAIAKALWNERINAREFVFDSLIRKRDSVSNSAPTRPPTRTSLLARRQVSARREPEHAAERRRSDLHHALPMAQFATRRGARARGGWCPSACRTCGAWCVTSLARK